MFNPKQEKRHPHVPDLIRDLPANAEAPDQARVGGRT